MTNSHMEVGQDDPVFVSCGISESSENVSASPAYHVEQLAVTLAGSEAVEVKAVLTFDIFLKKLISASMITNVSERQFDTDASVNARGSSVILCRMGKICGVWQKNI